MPRRPSPAGLGLDTNKMGLRTAGPPRLSRRAQQGGPGSAPWRQPFRGLSGSQHAGKRVPFVLWVCFFFYFFDLTTLTLTCRFNRLPGTTMVPLSFSV